MQTNYFRPSNRAAALWATVVEQYLISNHPDLSIREIRNRPMMRGVYYQLQLLEEGRMVPEPGDSADEVATAAYSSMMFFRAGSSLAKVTPTYKPDILQMMADFGKEVANTAEAGIYDAYIYVVVDTVNKLSGSRAFSTDDWMGFLLCTMVYLGIVMSVELATGSTVQRAIDKFVIQYVLKYFLKQFVDGSKVEEVVDKFTNFCSKFDLEKFAVENYRQPGKDYKAVPWKMPDDAQIIMLGDWGTGLEDAHDFLYELWKKAFLDAPKKQIVFIHLGDIYYCGLNVECERFFTDVFRSVGSRLERDLAAQQFKANAPIFTLPGNHEYYSKGRGYFLMIDKLNSHLKNKDIAQPYSFFCLRTNNSKWQFLGMDTGRDDGDGLMSALQAALEMVGWALPMQPKLDYEEKKWHEARLKEFGGKTILLSHHQLYSRRSKLNFKNPVYMNSSLRDTFKPHFNKVAAWFWGHEHSFAVYKDGLYGLNKGRLLGSSSYEVSKEADEPYKNEFPMVPYSEDMDDVKHKLGTTTTSGRTFYNHAAAIMSLKGDDIDVVYYQFPSWGQSELKPSTCNLERLYEERISNKNFVSFDPSWIGNDNLLVYGGNIQGVPSYDKTHSEQGQSMVAIGSHLHLLYIDSKTNKLRHVTTNAAKFKPESRKAQLYWESPQPVKSAEGSEYAAKKTPSVFAFKDELYAVLVDSQNIMRFLKQNADKTWKELFHTSAVDENFAPALCVHHHMLYMVYRKVPRQKDQVVISKYDLLAGKIYGAFDLKDEKGNMIEMADSCCMASNTMYHNEQELSAEVKQGAKDSVKNRKTFIQMVFRKSDNHLYTTRFSDEDEKWSQPQNIKMQGSNDKLKSYTRSCITYNSGLMYLVYTGVSEDHEMRLCILDCRDGMWMGNDAVKVKKDMMRADDNPSLVFAGGGAYLVYLKRKSKDINWCYF